MLQKFAEYVRPHQAIKERLCYVLKIEKKVLVKEDGRKLTFYHFPASATASQTEAFQTVDAPAISVGASQATPDDDSEGEANVGA